MREGKKGEECVDPRERGRESTVKHIISCFLCASANVIGIDNEVRVCSTNGREEKSYLLVGSLEGR